VFCHRYPTGACVAGNGEVRSLRDNVAASNRDGNPIVRSGCDCQHQGGQELGSNGKVNLGESLINVVSVDKPKVLTGLSQKARGQAWELRNLPPQM
jgi:hypothetical protein